jgi:hypothetical protein
MDIPPREVDASHNPYGQARITVLRYYRPDPWTALKRPDPFKNVIGTLVDECQY